jgi:hypothetical protein
MSINGMSYTHQKVIESCQDKILIITDKYFAGEISIHQAFNLLKPIANAVREIKKLYK